MQMSFALSRFMPLQRADFGIDGRIAGVDLGDDDEPVLPEVRQYTGGASNLTYLLRYPGADLVLRRPPSRRRGRDRGAPGHPDPPLPGG